MTTLQIKKEINKALDQVPDELLVDILGLILEVKSENPADSKTLISNFRKILSEDNDLLHKLAQ